MKGLHPNPLKDRERVIVKVKKGNKAREKERAGSRWASWQLSSESLAEQATSLASLLYRDRCPSKTGITEVV